ncbi:MAG: hypothetical protein NWF04_01385 [Candidatus Bathyarchaeota archaeon]|nr:hypothetical protein [Candidatus Bathyarchaeota archaeon]
MPEKVLITLRDDHLKAVDELVRLGAASSRSEMVDKIVGGFLADLKAKKRNSDTALGNLVGFLLLLFGIAAIAEILGGDS